MTGRLVLSSNQLKLKKAKPERLRKLGLDEAWLQSQIAQDPSLLGLGELDLLKKEKKQATGGRIGFLMSEPDDKVRYEIEVMLGELDASHIIRTIEYWDVERQRDPDVDHCAVIVAEEVTARFFNVIRLLNRAVPIIAIQLSAFRIGDEVVLHFTRVLDIYEGGGSREDEEGAEPADLGYWTKRTRPESLAVVESIASQISPDKGEPRITYNKHHIALGTDGYNFCWFYPSRKSMFCWVTIRLEPGKREEAVSQLEAVGIEAENHSRNQIGFDLDTKTAQEQRELIADILGRAEEWSHR
jgi:hypothetical protein